MGCSSEMRTRKENDEGQAMIEEMSKRNRGAVGGDAGRDGLVRRADWNEGSRDGSGREVGRMA